jgi:hypothetical protein
LCQYKDNNRLNPMMWVRVLEDATDVIITWRRMGRIGG